MCRGRLFQSSGTATENAVSPLSLDLNKKLLGGAGSMEKINQWEIRPVGAVKTNTSNLKSALNWTGSQ